MISTFYFLDEETERSNRKQGDVARREGEKTINALKVLRKIVSQMNFLRSSPLSVLFFVCCLFVLNGLPFFL